MNPFFSAPTPAASTCFLFFVLERLLTVIVSAKKPERSLDDDEADEAADLVRC